MHIKKQKKNNNLKYIYKLHKWILVKTQQLSFRMYIHMSVYISSMYLQYLPN